MERYCNYRHFDYDDYIEFLNNQRSKIFNTFEFREYRESFEKTTIIKNFKKRKSFLKLNKEEREKQLDEKFNQFVKGIEQEKLYYYLLSNDISKPILILKSPTGDEPSETNKLMKQFLGYEWSTAKNNEGIKYIGGADRTEDGDALTALKGIKDIKTPLFNPKDLEDETKLNSLFRKYFNGDSVEINEEQKNFVRLARLTDLIDFSNVKFNKEIRTTLQTNSELFSKYPLEKLGKICDIKIGGTPKRAVSEYFEGSNLWLSISEMNGQIIKDTKEKITEEAIKNSNVKLIPKGTTLLSFKLSIGKTAIAGADLYTNEAIAGLIHKDKTKILDSYLFHLFNGKMIDLENAGNKAFGKSLNSTYLKEELKIPLPPLDIQQKIVLECEKVDKEYENSRMKIEEYREKIAKVFTDLEVLYGSGEANNKLAQLCKPRNNKVNPNKKTGSVDYLGLENLESKTGKLVGDYHHPYQNIKSMKNIFEEGDILFGKLRPNLNKVYFARFDGICSTDILVLVADKEKVNAKLLSYYLRSKEFNEQVLLTVSGQQLPRTSWEKISNLRIFLPDLTKQQEIISQIEQLETKINELEEKMAQAPIQKKAILDSYLN